MDRVRRDISISSFPRVEREELLDAGAGTAEEVAENLWEMQRINDVLGGTRALTTHLYPRLLLHDHPVTLVDLGTGGAGLPRLLAGWARQMHLDLRILGVDWSERNLAAARIFGQADGVHLLRADALCLPFAPDSVDYVISTLFLHHLPPEKLAAVLAQSFSAAKHALIMSDLVRGWLPFLGFKLIQPFFAHNYLTRHDGALSVQRAYTAGELRRAAIRAGLPNPRVFTHFPWRMTLVVEK